MPGATALVTGSFWFLALMPGAIGSFVREGGARWCLSKTDYKSLPGGYFQSAC